MGHGTPELCPLFCFCWNDRRTTCDVDVKLLCFHYLNLVCNNYGNPDVCEIFVNCDVTCDWLCRIMYDLGLYIG